MTSRVGTFGGYKGRVIELWPDREGLLTCAFTTRPAISSSAPGGGA